jgi:hypothetical protein
MLRSIETDDSVKQIYPWTYPRILLGVRRPTHLYACGSRQLIPRRYIYYERKEQARQGRLNAARAPGVYSQRIQSGGRGYGTMAQPVI